MMTNEHAGSVAAQAAVGIDDNGVYGHANAARPQALVEVDDGGGYQEPEK